MTREQKIKKKQERSYLRKAKRIVKDKECLRTAQLNDRGYNMSWGRRYQHGSVFQCEMRYPDCELRGYCNGDC
jgi:hypothetical protein